MRTFLLILLCIYPCRIISKPVWISQNTTPNKIPCFTNFFDSSIIVSFNYKFKFLFTQPVAQTFLSVYDILGREVAVLVNESLKPGSYSVDWDATNYPSGVYFYKLEVVDPSSGSGRGFVESKKMVLIK